MTVMIQVMVQINGSESTTSIIFYRKDHFVCDTSRRTLISKEVFMKTNNQ